MKLFNMFAATLFSAALAHSSFALAEDNTSFDVLTGDMRLACERVNVPHLFNVISPSYIKNGKTP